MAYSADSTAIILVCTYNDFLSARGKAWPLVSKVAKEVNLLANLESLLAAGRELGITIAYAPHHRYKRGSFKDRKYKHPSQVLQTLTQSFKAGSFGSRFYPPFAPRAVDIVASEHDCSSGFTGTDLHEKLQEINVTHLILAGVLTNTCIESTARSAIDLGYHVTLLEDAVAAWSPEDHKTGVTFNYPKISHAVMKTSELVIQLKLEASHV
jgi:nicotinamidase-related amidase